MKHTEWNPNPKKPVAPAKPAAPKGKPEKAKPTTTPPSSGEK